MTTERRSVLTSLLTSPVSDGRVDDSAQYLHPICSILLHYIAEAASDDGWCCLGLNRVSKWFVRGLLMQSALEAAKVIGIVGGLVVLVSGVYFFAISRLALGIVAAVISGKMRQLLWSVVMVVVGVLAYEFDSGSSFWSYGPILVIVAGVIGIVVHIL